MRLDCNFIIPKRSHYNDEERGERLKQAKIEAEAEINAYRKQQEHAFLRSGNTDVREAAFVS